MTLEQILTEEDKASILNEVERERKKLLITKLYEDGMSNPDWDVRDGTASVLNFLFPINPTKCIELFKKHITEKEKREGVTEYLGYIIYSDKFVDLWCNNTTEDKESYVYYYVDINKLSVFCITEQDDIDFLVYSNKSVEAYEKSLPSVFKVLNDNTEDFANLIVLGERSPEQLGDMLEEVYTEAIKNNEQLIKQRVVDLLPFLVSFSPAKFLELYKRGIKDKENSIRIDTARTLGKLALCLIEDEIMIKDGAYKFLESYLHSKYIQNPDDTSRTKEDLQQELINLVRNSEGLDYKKLKDILDAGQAKDLDEMIECSKVNVKNYKVIKKVGEGAFKNVYLAESEKSPGYFVVLKQVNPSQFGIDSISQHYPSFKDWLNEELHITKLAKLKSPYVARPEAPIEGEDGNIYLVEEPFKETLRRKLKREGKLSIEETLKITLQIVQGLKDAHNYAEGQIIHRDLKPSNIGLDENGNVKLIDFGSLESMSRSPREGDLSNILYSAPEVLEGGKTTVRSNIYSVGVLMYEILTGENLFVPRDETGKLKPKPKEVGEEREEYKRETLKNLNQMSKVGLEERLAYLKDKIYGDKKDIKLIDRYYNIVSIIAGSIAYDPEDRVYNNMSELEGDLAKTISAFEGIYGGTTLPIQITMSKLISPADPPHVIKRVSSMATEVPLSRLRKYKDVISEEDYKKLEEALRPNFDKFSSFC